MPYPDPQMSDGVGSVPDRLPDAAASEKGRVLLLEDDASFRELITEFLTERGYTVVAVHNGTEGVREVLAGDFALILCDLMMPSVPGDTFYRTVERVRPHLASRFVFMTGHCNDERTNAFIQSVGGYLIQKPFPLADLLDLIVFAEVRSTFLSVFDDVPAVPAPALGLSPAEAPPEHVESAPEAHEVAADAPIPFPLVRIEPAPRPPEPVLPFVEPQRQVEEIEAPPKPLPEAKALPGAIAAPEERRVLLVDDDPSFNDIVRDFLVESGFTVVAVRSGGEAVREVLAGEFALVLCDLMMPGLPGDMFYRAVERIRPALCEQFIFMSGYRGDEKTTEFIKGVNGCLLRKPFLLQDLLDAITLTEARAGLPRTARPAATAPVSPPAPPLAGAVPVQSPVRRPGSWVEDTKPVLLPPVASVPYLLPGAQRAPASASPADGLPRTFILMGLALFIVLAVSLGIRGPSARDGAMAAAADRRALETEWKLALEQKKNAEEARQSLESLQQRARRLAGEKSSGWMGVLGAVSKVGAPGIVVQSIAAHGVEGSRGSARILIQGVATGPKPQAGAESCRTGLRREAEQRIAGTVVSQFDRLEIEPASPSTPIDALRASFSITMNLRLNAPPTNEKEVTR